MRANRDKALKEVERSIGAGKIDAALEQLRRIPDTHPNDFPVMNRMGDLLARKGRPGDAIFCYERIAQTFAQAGFVPKAIALYKKILRLDGDQAGSPPGIRSRRSRGRRPARGARPPGPGPVPCRMHRCRRC